MRKKAQAKMVSALPQVPCPWPLSEKAVLGPLVLPLLSLHLLPQAALPKITHVIKSRREGSTLLNGTAIAMALTQLLSISMCGQLNI